MFFSRSKKVNEDKTYLAVDIGTDSVKTILCKKDKTNINIIGYSRVKQDGFSVNKAVILDRESVLEAVDASIGFAFKQAEEKFDNLKLPEDIVIGIAGELVTGMPIVVNVNRDDPNEKITEEEIAKIVNKVKDMTFDSAKMEIAKEHGIPLAQLKEIDTLINSVSIDGIKLENPIDHTGDQISYRVFSSFAPKAQIESIQMLAASMKLNLTDIPVEPYSLARAVSEYTSTKEGAIIIDIGAGTSDIVVAREGDILGLKMFGIGGRTFTNRIQKEFAVDHEEAESMKLQYANDELDAYRKKEVASALKKDIKTWLLGIELSLADMDSIETFPSNIYLCGGGALLPGMLEGIMEYSWIQKLPFIKHPSVSFLYPNKVDKVVDLTRSVNNVINVTPVALARSFLDK